jgi:hypothetical protein
LHKLDIFNFLFTPQSSSHASRCKIRFKNTARAVSNMSGVDARVRMNDHDLVNLTKPTPPRLRVRLSRQPKISVRRNVNDGGLD